MPVIIASGTRSYGDSASLHWCLIRGVLSDEEIESFCCEKGAVYHYAGPGQSFADCPYWRTSRSYTLIKQRAGLDI